MASNGSSRGKLLTAGGILSIIAGIYLIIAIIVWQLLTGSILLNILPFFFWFIRLQFAIYMVLSLLLALPLGDLAGHFWYGLMGTAVPQLLISVGNVVLGSMAVIGGISAIKRKWFRISLAGAIGALPLVIPGILAIIFVVLGKREFKDKEIYVEVV